jgi:hypothetical protein
LASCDYYIPNNMEFIHNCNSLQYRIFSIKKIIDRTEGMW